MEYTKDFKTIEEQANLMISRGLICDKMVLQERLQWINYYRFSGYLYPFRQEGSDNYIEGTSLDTIWNRYCFDRKLRLLILDGIARIEIGIKTAIIQVFAREKGPFGYTERDSLPNIDDEEFNDLIHKLQDDTESSKAQFVIAFREKYGDDHSNLPLWMAMELMTFGSMLKFYEGMDKELQNEIAAKFYQQKASFISWLKSLNVVRNICAHHDRLWNRVLGVKPILYPKNDEKKRKSKWFSPIPINNNRVFATITLIIECLSVIAPKSGWKSRLLKLLDNYPDIPISEMGFPKYWKQTPFFASDN